MSKNIILQGLQKKATDFLTNHYLVVNGIEIYPKEIEVYYYKEGEFDDKYVHRDVLQANRPNKFYVHRKGRGGCDFVQSDRADVYYSYLIRSVVIGGELFVGPINSYEAILDKTGLSKEQLNEVDVTVATSDKAFDVLTDVRIGLNQNSDIDQFYLDAELRFILLDENFEPRKDKKQHYKNRERAFVNTMQRKQAEQTITRDEVISEAKRCLRYVPKVLKS